MPKQCALFREQYASWDGLVDHTNPPGPRTILSPPTLEDSQAYDLVSARPIARISLAWTRGAHHAATPCRMHLDTSHIDPQPWAWAASTHTPWHCAAAKERPRVLKIFPTMVTCFNTFTHYAGHDYPSILDFGNSPIPLRGPCRRRLTTITAVTLPSLRLHGWYLGR